MGTYAFRTPERHFVDQVALLILEKFPDLLKACSAPDDNWIVLLLEDNTDQEEACLKLLKETFSLEPGNFLSAYNMLTSALRALTNQLDLTWSGMWTVDVLVDRPDESTAHKLLARLMHIKNALALAEQTVGQPSYRYQGYSDEEVAAFSIEELGPKIRAVSGRLGLSPFGEYALETIKQDYRSKPTEERDETVRGLVELEALEDLWAQVPENLRD